MARNYKLSEMTWGEAEKAIKEADFVVLPTGSIEQHSTHLPLSVDSIRAEELTKLLAESSKDLRFVVLPTLYYGYSEHHIHFPGTITLGSDTYRRVIEDIGWSLKQHGAKHLLILNFHGGNKTPIQLAVNRLQREIGIETHFIHWTSFARDLVVKWAKSEDWGHACEYETSLTLLFRPDLVRKEKIEKQRVKRRKRTQPLRYWEDFSEQGGTGDPTKASAEFAKHLVEEVTQRILKDLKADLQGT